MLRKALKRMKHLKRNKKLQNQSETYEFSDLKPGSGLSALHCATSNLSSCTLELCSEVQLHIKASDGSRGTVRDPESQPWVEKNLGTQHADRPFSSENPNESREGCLQTPKY